MASNCCSSTWDKDPFEGLGTNPTVWAPSAQNVEGLVRAGISSSASTTRAFALAQQKHHASCSMTPTECPHRRLLTILSIATALCCVPCSVSPAGLGNWVGTRKSCTRCDSYSGYVVTWTTTINWGRATLGTINPTANVTTDDAQPSSYQCRLGVAGLSISTARRC